jgi:hypothetical protein
MESLIDKLFAGLVLGAIISAIYASSGFPHLINGSPRGRRTKFLIERAGRMKTIPYYLYVWLLYGVLMGGVIGVVMQFIVLITRPVFRPEQSVSIYPGIFGFLLSGLVLCTVVSLVMAWRLRKHVLDDKPEQQE